MRFALVFALLSMPALAGERLLGTIVATTDKTNDTTATPFFVPSDAKISIQCDASAYILTDTSTAVSASNGVLIGSGVLFPTSTGTQVKVSSGTAANGGAVVRAIAVTGTANCKVFERRGNE